MILGRSTVQWTALIATTLSFVQIVIQLALPAWSDEAAIVLPALGILLGGYIAFLANTQTTPTSDPRLPAGAVVTVLDDKGKATPDTVEIQPTPPGPVGTSGEATGATP